MALKVRLTRGLIGRTPGTSFLSSLLGQRVSVPPTQSQQAAALFAPVPAAEPRQVVTTTPRPLSRTTQQQFGHLIVIPTQNRPALLGRCIQSIAENMRRYGYSRKLTVAVVDDSTDSRFEKANGKMLQQLAARYPHLFEIIHYDKASQAKFTAEIERKAGVKLHDFLYPDKSKAKHGFGGVRNLSLLVAMAHASGNDLVTFFDDDITLENLHLRKDGSRVVPAKGHLFNFFQRLDSIFSNSSVHLISGRVTKDVREPQHLIPYYLGKVKLFMNEAGRRDPNDRLGNLAQEITEVPELGREIPFDRALRMLSVFSHGVVRRGAFNAGLRYYDPDAPSLVPIERTSSLGGANVTLRASLLVRSIPYPTVGIRGEDTTWSMLMHRLLGGGVYRVNLPVLHHKGGSRDPLKEYGQSISFWPVYDTIKPIHSSSSLEHLANQLRINATESTIALGNRRIKQHIATELAKWDLLAGQAAHALENRAAWWNRDPRLKQAAERLRRNVNYFRDRKRDEVMQHVIPPDKMLGALHQYSDLIRAWPKVVRAFSQRGTERAEAVA